MIQHIGAAILAGGQSSRMHTSKADLYYEGNSFLRRTLKVIPPYPEVLLSVRNSHDFAEFEIPTVPDLIPDCGPAGGIYSILSACQSDWMVTLSCDMPLLKRGLIEYLTAFIASDYDACVMKDRSGRVHPLCAVYAKSCLPVFQKALESKTYKLQTILDHLRVKYVPLEFSAFADSMLSNVNTPEEYRALPHRPLVVAVCGKKNSGKTTLLESVLPYLCREGLQIAAIKHDGHDFVPDVPGTDSYRLRQAGAHAVGIFSSRQCLSYSYAEGTTFETLINQFQKHDLILLEGGKTTDYPKIEIVRKEISLSSLPNITNRIAICTDLPLKGQNVPLLPVNDPKSVAAFLLSYVEKCKAEDFHTF
jgi:molybdopterin-guanine dinucleotide biosynthesis protein